MVRLALDARKLADFGIGSYLQALIGHYREHTDAGLLLLLSPGGRALLPPLPSHWEVVELEAPGYSFREQLTLPWVLLRHRPRLLHVPHYVIPLAYPGPMVVTIHDIIHVLFPEFLPSHWGLTYAAFMIRQAVRRARTTIAVSHTTAQDLIRLFGANPAKVRVIPNGVDESFWKSPARFQKELSRPYILHVGNHKPHKNVESVLKAYQLLTQSGGSQVPDLVLAGGFAPDGPLARRAQALGLGERVRCLGFLPREELPALFRGAAVFVYPSLYEGFGLPVLEAAACGVPVVAGDVPAIREMMGNAVLLVNPRDVREIAAALRRVLEDRALAHQLAQEGRERASRFRWCQAAEATWQVYQQVLTEQP